jgi:hypothetical protein
MHSHLYNSTTGLVGDLIFSDNCTSNGSEYIYASALFLEGIAILGAITGNPIVQDL